MQPYYLPRSVKGFAVGMSSPASVNECLDVLLLGNEKDPELLKKYYDRDFLNRTPFVAFKERKEFYKTK